MPIHRLATILRPVALDACWDAPHWRRIAPLALASFLPVPGTQRPRVAARLARSPAHLHIIFRTCSRHLRRRVLRANGPVWTDSCVELFLQPWPGGAYVNLEFSAAGTPLASLIRDPRRTEDGFADRRFADPRQLAGLRLASSVPPAPDDLPGPAVWCLEAEIPLALLDGLFGRPVPRRGAWRGNLYGCADHAAEPYYAAWSPVGPRWDFHQPARFGRLLLSRP